MWTAPCDDGERPRPNALTCRDERMVMSTRFTVGGMTISSDVNVSFTGDYHVLRYQCRASGSGSPATGNGGVQLKPHMTVRSAHEYTLGRRLPSWPPDCSGS